MPQSAKELTAAERAAEEFQQTCRHGQKESAQVRRVLVEMTWHKKLAEAAKVATTQHKPIVWVQALGDIRGFT